MTGPLPPGQPLWSATLVTGLAGDACALIVVFHHVLADGMGGLAILASLVDGVGSPPARGFPGAEALLAPACPGRGRQQAPYSREPLGRPSPAAGHSC